MKEIMITSSVLILCIMLIRIVFKGRISGRLQYALWLLVALRLIVPSSAQIHMAIGSIEEFRIMDLAEALEERFGDVTEQLEKPVQFHMSLDGPLGEQALAFMLGEELNLPSEDGPTSVFVAGKVGGLIWMDMDRRYGRCRLLDGYHEHRIYAEVAQRAQGVYAAARTGVSVRQENTGSG